MNALILNWRDPKNPQAGGAEKATLYHAKGLLEKGHGVVWFCSSFKNSKGEEIVDGIVYLRRGNAYTVFFYAFAYLLFNQRKYDLIIDEIHGFGFFTPLYVYKPKISYIHEIAGDIWNVMFPFPINRIGRFIESLMFLAYKNEHFLTVSESTKRELLAKGIKSANIHVITNGIEKTKLLSLPKEKNPTLIFINRLVKMKGIEDVLRALGLILQKKPSVRLWVLGSGDEKYMDYLRLFCKTLNISRNVIFYGFVNDKKKNELLRKSQILLHASMKEGWGLVIIEAALQKTPAVVYNVPGLVDSVINNKTGIIVNENTPVALAQKTLDLLDNNNKLIILAENAFKKAHDYSWDIAMEKSSRLFEKVANK